MWNVHSSIMTLFADPPCFPGHFAVRGTVDPFRQPVPCARFPACPPEDPRNAEGVAPGHPFRVSPRGYNPP
ncbi:hypothetical protein Nans01_12050 [Nocardiopsis ansamitocini]|uniref:Uncharacterized protein n=1 Tax=Nocardiopsis ansamitocini TaxID=1670832 RepID=A0A9W6P4B9_9ACTN|nr:hypothetical protein Nans01_12050 [Nocardiopsis ansamitocini]